MWMYVLAELTTNRSNVISPVCTVQEVIVYTVYSAQSIVLCTGSPRIR